MISATRAPVALTSRDAFMLSAMAKLLATLVTYPAIVIKSRMQVMCGFNGPVDHCAVHTPVQMWWEARGWSSTLALP